MLLQYQLSLEIFIQTVFTFGVFRLIVLCDEFILKIFLSKKLCSALESNNLHFIPTWVKYV
jgi:hypothetical protein